MVRRGDLPALVTEFPAFVTDFRGPRKGPVACAPTAMPFPLRPFLAALGLGAGTLSAQTFATFNGSSSNDWFTPGNWNTGSVPTASISPYVPTGRTVVVSGGNAVGNQFQASSGTLRVQNGGTATFGSTFLDFDAGSHSSLQVDGAGSLLSFSTGSPNYFSYGTNAATSLTVTNGGRYQSSGANDYYGWGTGSVTTLQVTDGSYSVAGARIGYNLGTQASLTVSGSNASFTSSNTLNVGYFGQGSFQLSGGAQGTSAAVDIAAGAAGGAGISGGTALVTGAGTVWNISGNIRLGSNGSPSFYAYGTLTVANGATLNAPTSTVLINAGSTLSIGNGGAAGTLNVGGVAFADTFSASGRLVFNHSDNLTFSAARMGLGTLVKGRRRHAHARRREHEVRRHHGQRRHPPPRQQQRPRVGQRHPHHERRHARPERLHADAESPLAHRQLDPPLFHHHADEFLQRRADVDRHVEPARLRAGIRPALLRQRPEPGPARADQCARLDGRFRPERLRALYRNDGRSRARYLGSRCRCLGISRWDLSPSVAAEFAAQPSGLNGSLYHFSPERPGGPPKIIPPAWAPTLPPREARTLEHPSWTPRTGTCRPRVFSAASLPSWFFSLVRVDAFRTSNWV